MNGKCQLTVHPKSKTKLKSRLKELTSRSNGWGYTKRKHKLKEYIRGWVGYYHLANMKRLMLETDEWLRRRIRMCIWKAWKKVETKVANLIRCGIDKYKAYEWGNTRKGYWRIADSPILTRAIVFQIDQIIDWNPIRGLIEIAYTKGNRPTGRPSYDSLVLFKTELLRTWYGLSDGEVEEQVNDRLSFSRFVGLGLDECAPDSTTVCRFRNILVEANLYDNVLQEINRQLELTGVLVKRGAIVDASITDTPRRPRGRKEYEVVEDRNEESGRDVAESAVVKESVKPNVDGEARWVKKMGKLHFGYKRHSVTDENGLVITEETTPANESDIKHLEKPLEKAKLPRGTPVYADKGYDSTANKDVLKRMKLKSRIMHKGVRGRKLTEREQRANVAISKTRYKVERTFGSIHR